MVQTLPLNWQTDPMYFDPEPVPTRLWLNANDLMRANKTTEFLSQQNMLHLFPIMVRHSDFVRKKQSDRILARFPYIELLTEEKELIAKQDLLVAERLRNYFYKSDNRKVLEWRAILQKDLKRGFVPLPFLRCFPEEISIDFATRIFESARGEAFKMPTQITEEIAYLSGMVNGDGSLTKYVVNIVDFSIENIQQLKKMFEQLFHQIGRIQLQTENSPTLIITNLWVVRLFSFLTSQPIGGKKYDALQEPLIFKKEPFRKHYWSGVMDADGSYANRNVTLTSTSNEFARDFSLFLKSLQIQSTVHTREDGTYQVYIPRRYHEIYKTQMISKHPEKRKEFLQLRKGRNRKTINAHKFQDFDQKKLLNGYFNFTLMKNLQIVGLGNYVKEKRQPTTQQEYAEKLGISTKTLQLIESGENALSIKILEQILLEEKLSLMQFLVCYGRKIKFRRYRAAPVYLDFKPNDQLKFFAKKLIFYENSIRINSEDKKLLSDIELHFGITIENNVIRNGVIRYFFKTFSEFTNYTM